MTKKSVFSRLRLPPKNKNANVISVKSDTSVSNSDSNEIDVVTLLSLSNRLETKNVTVASLKECKVQKKNTDT